MRIHQLAEATVNPGFKEILGAATIVFSAKLDINERASVLMASLLHTIGAQP